MRLFPCSIFALVTGLALAAPPCGDGVPVDDQYHAVTDRSSADVKPRCLPIGRSPMAIDPIRTRTSFRTLPPSASTMRRTWRLRPSVSVISNTVRPEPSRTRVTRAGRVGPSSSSTPRRSVARCRRAGSPP